ncbi:microtubule-associated protein 4-like [Seriola aureovittata]|uniref:microtubule-associated protein 4-like n=1 Tax=Seriola aureovittata TaxID=2871759 RepID=UPI0024BE12B2|nr:microtubule-associated protein 4-like [Seriola aureovittata]
MEKKPAVPRAHRTPRPINAPTPDLKNVRSKIGSIDNIKYQPGGGKVSSTPNKTSDPCAPAAKARVSPPTIYTLTPHTLPPSLCSNHPHSPFYIHPGHTTPSAVPC